MCGIVAYVGPQPARDVVLAGLRRLEYRGYDSAGIAIVWPAVWRSRRPSAGRGPHAQSFVATSRMLTTPVGDPSPVAALLTGLGPVRT